MSKIKISKYRNTGLIFELLSKRMVSEVMKGNSPSLNILKKYFKPSSELGKEYSLYKLFTEDIKDPERLIEIAIQEFAKLDSKSISRQKYNLIKEIKTNYDLEEFFKHKVPNYRLHGALNYLYENTGFGNAKEKLHARQIISEHLRPKDKPFINESESFTKIDKDTQKLAVKLMIEKFNAKYENLYPKQRMILSSYMLDGTDSPKFKKMVMTECKEINQSLASIATPSERLDIKIKEAIHLLENIITSKVVKDEHVSALLKYHELINKLGK